MGKNDSFSNFHPAVNFLFLTLALIFSMFVQNPYFVLISFFSAMVYNIYIFSLTGFLKKMRFIIFTFIFVLIFNPLFNHRGMTILFYLKSGNPVTLESIIFAIISALMLVTVIMWFFVYSNTMTSDKTIYLFSKISPTFSLIFSMALRFVPLYVKKAKDINNAQKYIKRKRDKNFISDIKRGANVFSSLVSSALEDSIVTADSMKARGYGLKNRTAYSNYFWNTKQRNIFLIYLSFLVFFIFAIYRGFMKAQYYPYIKIEKLNLSSAAILFLYALFLNSPMIFNLLEEKKWQILKSKI